MQQHLIQNQVDFILFEEGCFSPLNWLIREGHIDYSNYLKWKSGESLYLEDHFITPSATLIKTLEQARDYAIQLKLNPFRQAYASTNDQELYFCRSPANNFIFNHIYEPTNDRIQMDLFLDSADICTQSDLKSAIINKRHSEVTDLLAKLETLNPDKYQQFSQLLAFEKKVIRSRISGDKKIAFLLQTLTPLTLELLGRFSHDFLTPLWQKISLDITDKHFDSTKPEFHLSFTASKCFQWQQVLTSIEQEKNWQEHPLLIFRYAESYFKLNKELEGITNWFHLFLLFPIDAENLIKNSGNHLLLADWLHFTELEPELETSLFPAWMIISKPALANNKAISTVIQNDAVLLITHLIDNKKAGLNKKMIHLRAELKKSHPPLFTHYMRAYSAT